MVISWLIKKYACLMDAVHISEQDRRELIKEHDNMLEEIKKNA